MPKTKPRTAPRPGRTVPEPEVGATPSVPTDLAKRRYTRGVRVGQLVNAAFHQPESRIYRVVQGFVWTLIAGSVVLVAAGLAIDPQSPRGRLITRIDHVVLWVFAVEYVLRVLSYRPPGIDLFERTRSQRLLFHVATRISFCLTPMMLVDLATVIALAPQLRGLRALRLLRLLRVPKVFRYANPFHSIMASFRDNRLMFLFGFILVAGATILGGLSLYLTEGPLTRTESPIDGLGDGLWWALVTLTTVGYGDITPVTGVGRAIGGALMVAGMFTIALFAGIISQTLLQAVLSIREEQFRMSTYVNHLVVCGYDPGARMLLDALLAEGECADRTVVLFANGERPTDVPSHFTWVNGDPTKESELEKVRLSHAASVVVVGSRAVEPQQADARTILTLFTLRSFLERTGASERRKTPLHVVAEILDAENVAHAHTAGADEVIETTRLGFSMLAHSLIAPGSATIMSRMADAPAHSLFVDPIPESIGLPAPFEEVRRRVKAEKGAMVIGFRLPGVREDQINPADDVLVPPGSLLVYIADDHALA